ncbi:MAG: phosphatase PAP2 family protein [Eubacteriales bacterium]|nr:phosphatase PAP2 family protein [Eubacteriales bacterium]
MDIGILRFIQENFRNEYLTAFFKFITSLGNAGWFWIALALVLLIFKKTRRTGTGTLLSLGTGFIITNLFLKNIVRRTRPYDAYSFIVPLIEHPSDFSFPSGHTCASFAAAFVLYRAFPKKYSWLFLLLAVLIAFSRLYLGVHYPSDVLAGFVIGAFSACLSDLIMEKINKNRK